MSEGPFPQAQAAEDTPWVSVSDLMSGLMLVFLCIAVLFMREVQQDRDRYAQVAEEYSNTKVRIRAELEREFPDGNPDGAQLVQGELIIRFLDEDAGYAPAQREVPQPFQQKLGPFMGKLLDILEREEFQEHIVELRIEGHTSSDWYGATPREAYLKNMDLSQARALFVLKHVMGLSRVTEGRGTEDWLRSVLRANGMSSSQLIQTAGEEDPVLSKRVEFRIVTDADKKMDELLTLAPSL